MKQLFTLEFIRFLSIGGIAAAVNFFSRILLSEWLVFKIAVIVAYMIGMVVAFILFRVFVFKASKHGIKKEAYYFVMVNLLAIVQVWLISVGLAEYLFPAIEFSFYREEIAHLVGISVPAITSYYGHKYWSFAQQD